MTASLDFGRDLVVHWPAATPAVVPFLRQLEARALLTEPSDLSPKLAAACRAAEVALIADIPADRVAVRAAQGAGFTAAAIPASGEAAEFGDLLRQFRDFVTFVYLTPEQIDWNVQPAQSVLRYGVWPGISTPDAGTAGATESVWLDANTSLIAQLRALYPRRRAVLGYRPDKDGGVPETRSVPASSAEVALADAFSAGGNVVLSLPSLYRDGLLAQEPRALQAWKALTVVHQFIRGARTVTEAPFVGRSAVLCGTIEQTGEILNLAFRRNLCPVALPATPPPLTKAQFDVVVAANATLTAAAIENVARYAASGGVVMAAPAGDEKTPWWTRRGWKKQRAEEDRDVYAAGSGTLYAYAAIDDPGRFALDLKEVLGQLSQPGVGLKNLDMRIWAADSVLGVLHRLSPTSIALVLTAYGGLPRHDFLVSVRGRYRRATLCQVGSPAAVPLQLMARTGRVEINLTQISRIAIVTLEE